VTRANFELEELRSRERMRFINRTQEDFFAQIDGKSSAEKDLRDMIELFSQLVREFPEIANSSLFQDSGLEKFLLE
jgi:hypothetical protein